MLIGMVELIKLIMSLFKGYQKTEFVLTLKKGTGGQIKLSLLVLLSTVSTVV